MMRNTWYPKKVARYPDFDERKAIKSGQIDVERDYDFDATIREAVAGQKKSQTATGAVEAAWRKYLDGALPEGSGQGDSKTQAIEIKPVDVRCWIFSVMLHLLMCYSRNEPSPFLTYCYLPT